MESNILKNSKILIVDDTPSNIEVLELMLHYEDFVNYKSTTDSRNVLEMYIDFEPDLILLDLNMPYMSGYEVMEQLRKLINDQFYLPILVLTADASDTAKKKALSSGASDFLSKPFDLIEVNLRIKNLLYTNYLYKQVRNQNEILEEKVKERTRELELKNEELKKAWEKAESSNRLKEAFINNISHEIRTPLNGIIGFSHLLTDPSIGFDEKSSYLNIMHESSNRLINTVTSFLDISLINSGNMEPFMAEFSPKKMLLEIFAKYQAECEKKNILLELIAENFSDDFLLNTDENILCKIFEQLIDNAVKFTRKGLIKIGAEVGDREIIFFIKDTGKGISDDFKNNIFNSFNQEEVGITRTHEGLGLGLSISKGLLDLLGGKIWYNSEKGKGSEFYFSLPIRAIETKLYHNDLNTSTKKTTHKILIVEDDETSYYLLYYLLMNMNIELLHAHNGKEAMKLFKDNPDTDLILLDLKLPDIEGYQVAEKIKKMNNQIHVIAISSYSGMIERQQAFRSGCDDYIVKPITKNVLLEKLSKQILIHPQ